MRRWLGIIWVAWLACSWSCLYAQNYTESVIEDFEDGNTWSPFTTLGWWHLDDKDVYSYSVTQDIVFKGEYAMRVDYHKTAPYQLVAGYLDAINPKKDFSGYDFLRLRVYGAVKVLLKLEDRRGGQINVGIKTALDTDKWNELEFDYSKTDLDKTNIKNIFLFIAPNDPQAQGTIYIDSISLAKRVKGLALVSHGWSEKKSESGVEDISGGEAALPQLLDMVSAVDLVQDQAGHIYILQQMAGLVFEYNTQGYYVGERLHFGNQPGELNQPSAMAFDPSGEHLYVVDRGNHRLQKFDEKGALLESFAEKGILNWRGDGQVFGDICDVAVDASGRVYVLDAADKTIWVYEDEGRAGKLFWKNQGDSFFLNPIRMEVFRERLYVADAGAAAIDVFDLQGVYVQTMQCVDAKGKKFSPLDFSFDPASETCLVISAENPGIFVFDKNWNYIGISNPARLVHPAFIKVCRTEGGGLICVGDKGQNGVRIIPLEELKNAIK